MKYVLDTLFMKGFVACPRRARMLERDSSDTRHTVVHEGNAMEGNRFLLLYVHMMTVWFAGDRMINPQLATRRRLMS